MTNNDVFRRLKYAFNYNPEKIILLFNHVGVKVVREDVSKWLEKDTEEKENLSLSDEQFASFLNGMIIDNRGKKDGQIPVAEKELDNNIVFRKLRIALNLKDTDILALLKLAGLNFGKSELSAFFRKPGHQHYKKCQDQVLRNFLNGLFLKHHETQKK
ncbi:YehS family protein [Wenyingzhuangia marina]|uniref:Uncharacterized conserved protein YehS, DUF1456 family n=1 Tax=Wenyingzhuangia marina TaxID=1195760 RepID=A0A1M5W6S0_9FLAO|nr:DUF1456 family protein [Wenyingzhuangia marina]GGF75455.1 DUF1456 domain-containing protein [Wenyingzhuangia marina]SHH83171.1 Uncharacterized conserved protein YehS, DUF1456 family [Wenyingzhuangia marina]